MYLYVSTKQHQETVAFVIVCTFRERLSPFPSNKYIFKYLTCEWDR